MTPNELVERIRGGDPDRAISDFLAITPEATLELLAVNAMNWHMPDVVEVILRRLIAEEPENLGGHLTLADSLYSQSRFAEALPHYQFCIKHRPNDPWIHSGVCWGLSSLARFDELRDAIQDAKRSIPAGEHLSWQSARLIRDMTRSTVDAVWASIATAIHEKIKERRQESSTHEVATWTPRPEPQHPGHELFGWSITFPDARGWFEVDHQEMLPATPTTNDGATLWRASFNGVKGASHHVRFCVETSDGKVLSGGEVPLRIKGNSFAKAMTGTASEIGAGGATLVGEVAAGDGAPRDVRELLVMEFHRAPHNKLRI